VSHLPALGRRGEGWFLLQLALLFGVGISGALLGPNVGGGFRFVVAMAGVVSLVIGVALAGLGIRDLGPSLSPLPYPVESGVLVQHGVYRQVRHPIYAAVVMIAVGWSLVGASLIALALSIALAMLLDLKARREERWLEERYPGYTAYARRTRRFLPGIY
jgi:protein-S-isoprenylcysteine O-methyltransferase Ste14